MAEDIFSPEFQDIFWRTIDPESMSLLRLFEEKEEWTLKYNEKPEFYESMAHLIPDIMEYSPSSEDSSLVDELIKIVSTMTLKNHISALLWLDKEASSDDFKGWSATLYQRASVILGKGSDVDDNFSRLAKICIERVQLMVRLKLLSQLFGK